MKNGEFPLDFYLSVEAKTREQIVTALKKVIQDIQNGARSGSVDGAFDYRFHITEKSKDPEVGG